MSKLIYLDHHSTTPVRPEVVAAMQPWLTDSFGNSASSHAFGRRARNAMEEARETVAKCLGAAPNEVIFTSGATEANNLALFGLAGDAPCHILTSAIEHPCVVEPLQRLAKRGFDVENVPVGGDGLVDVQKIIGRLRPTTRLVVLMATNHETGAQQSAVPPGNYFWHCDAAQTAGKRPIDFRQLGATTLTISGHKFGAPIGIGALLVRQGINLKPLLFGGHQQHGRRPGTEPVALAVGLAAALDAACRNQAAELQHVRQLRQRMIERLAADAGPIVINGPIEDALQSPSVLNISFPGLRADALLMALDVAGVACSTGSACSSGSLLPSPVLQAMGVPDDVLKSAMRFSFGITTTMTELEEATERVIETIKRLRTSAF
jgi:cysteine desulfurase